MEKLLPVVVDGADSLPPQNYPTPATKAASRSIVVGLCLIPPPPVS